MLIGFSVGNYKSFKEIATLNLIVESREPLKISLIFGANNSGKTNLLRAIKAMSSMVRFGLSCWLPFKKDEDSIGEPSFFEVVFLARSGDRVQYGFKIKRGYVEGEWLYKYNSSDNTNTRVIVFERDRLGLIEGCQGNLLDTELFLCKMATPESDTVREFFDLTYVGLFTNKKDIDEKIIEFVLENPTLSSRLSKLMSAIDLPIPDPALRLPNSRGFDEAFGFLSLLLFVEEKKIKLLAIDNFSENLHPLLASSLIKIANSLTAELQLIVATHQVRLMDEVPLTATWVVEKDNKQASTLTGVAEYKIKTGNVSRKYLNGMLGGVPLVNIIY